MPTELVQVQLVLRLEGADRLELVDLGAEGADQRGLSSPLRPGDHDRAPSAHRSPQERGDDGRHHVALHEVVQRDPHQPVPTDHDGRSRGHPRHGRQPGAAVQPHVEARLRLGERASIHLAARSKEDEEVDQLLIGVGHRRSGNERPVDQLELHVVVADDDDVLDPVVIHQWLEAAEAEERVEHGLRGGLLLRGTP